MDSNRITYNDTVLTKSERYFHLQKYNEMFTKLYAKFSGISTNSDIKNLRAYVFNKEEYSDKIILKQK